MELADHHIFVSIEKVKEELETRFVRFNQKFKEEKGESFGDFVVKKLADSNDFYFSSDRVWREIEETKEEIQRKTLNIAPTAPFGLQREDNTTLANLLSELGKECKDYLGLESVKKNKKVTDKEVSVQSKQGEIDSLKDKLENALIGSLDDKLGELE